MKHQERPKRTKSEVPWYLFRYNEALSILKDDRFVVDPSKVASLRGDVQASEEVEPYYEVRSHWMVYKDPPNHTRLRSLVNKAFTPKLVQELKPRIEQITGFLLDKVQPHGEMDIVSDLAFP